MPTLTRNSGEKQSLKFILMGAAAALALGASACSKKTAEEGTDSEGKVVDTIESAVVDISGGSPIDKPFKLDNAEPLDMDGFVTLMNQEEESNFKFASSEFDESIGATVLTDVTTSDNDGSMTIGRVELFGVNSDYIQRLQNEEVSDTKESIFRKIRMFDLNLSGSGEGEVGAVTIGAVEIDNVKLGGFDPEELETTNDDGVQFATVMKGFELGGIYLKDMKLDGIEAEGTGIDMVVSDMRFGGLNGGVVGPVLVKDMDYTVRQSAEAKQKLIENGDPQMAALLNGPLGNLIMPEKQQATLESLTWDGMSFAGLLPYLEKGEMPPLDAKNVLTFGKMEAKNATNIVNGKQAAVTEYSVMDPIEFTWLVPTRIRSASKNSTLDLTAYVPEGQPELLAVFTEAGADKVSGDGEMIWDYDDKKGDASFVYDADAKGLANIDLSFNASNAVLETLHAAAQAEDESAFMNMQLDGFSLKIEDDNLLNLVFGIAALQMGQEPEQLRASAPLFISMGGQQFAGVNPAIPGYLEAISNWVSTGGTIEIKIDPEEPVTFGALAIAGQTTPQTLPDVLNLTVTHTE